MSTLTIKDLDVVLLKNSEQGTVVYTHDKNIEPQGYEVEISDTGQVITVTDKDIDKVLYSFDEKTSKSIKVSD